jgi:hypothetical protein
VSQKRRAGENTEWRRGVGLRSPTAGAEFPLHEATFFGGAEICPYKPHVGAFVGENGNGHAAYRDMSVTVPGCVSPALRFCGGRKCFVFKLLNIRCRKAGENLLLLFQ